VKPAGSRPVNLLDALQQAFRLHGLGATPTTKPSK
jgi:hypothetical protein